MALDDLIADEHERIRALTDLGSEAWWRNAGVERLDDGPVWRVTDNSPNEYQSLIGLIGERLIGRAVVFSARVDRRVGPGAVSAFRLLLTHRNSGRETIWEALFDPHTGEHRVQANAYGAFAEVHDEGRAFAVSVVAIISEQEIVDARAQIVPAIGLSLDDQGPDAVGGIVVREVLLRIVPLSEGRRLTLQFRRDQIRSARRVDGAEAARA